MSYALLSRRLLLFKSFTGLAVSEFDTVSREIESKYVEHESVFLIGKEKEISVLVDHTNRKSEKERFLMLLAYYRLYITFTLSGNIFLFDLDQSNICRDISRQCIRPRSIGDSL